MADTNFYRATITQLLYGQQIQNVLHFVGPNSNTGALNTLANDIDTIWVDQFRRVQTFAITYISIKVEALGSDLPPFIKTISKRGNSSDSSNIDPCQACIVRLRTARAGRTGRGRTYIAGIFGNLFDFGIATAPAQTAFNDIFAQVLGNTGFGSSIFKLAVGKKTAPHDLVEVDSMQLAPTAGHQRRRNIGIGI